MQLYLFAVDPLESRKLLAGVAPGSVAGYSFELELNGEAYFQGHPTLLVAPVSDQYFVDDQPGAPIENQTRGTFDYEKVSSTTAHLTLHDPKRGTIQTSLHFDTPLSGQIYLAGKGDPQDGTFLVTSSQPILHFSGSVGDDLPGELVVFGTKRDDTIDLQIEANGDLDVIVNDSTQKIPSHLIKSIEVQAGAGDDEVSIASSVTGNFTDADKPNGVLVVGDDGDDKISTGDGNDTIIGGGGDDKIIGGAGDDSLSGGSGTDALFGDFIDGSNLKGGDDTLNPGTGSKDFALGGAGFDTVTYAKRSDPLVLKLSTDKFDSGATGERDKLFAEAIIGGSGDDEITGNDTGSELHGGDGDDLIHGGDGSDYITGDDGNDTIFGGSGDDNVATGAGKNVADGEDGDDRVRGSGGRDQLTGGGGSDRLFGEGGSDTLFGGGGTDRLVGGDGDDNLYGGGSNDRLFGEKGNDLLAGQGGSDVMDGGSGNDTAIVDPNDPDVVGVEHVG